jgi:hypothetical protein
VRVVRTASEKERQGEQTEEREEAIEGGREENAAGDVTLAEEPEVDRGVGGEEQAEGAGRWAAASTMSKVARMPLRRST